MEFEKLTQQSIIQRIVEQNKSYLISSIIMSVRYQRKGKLNTSTKDQHLSNQQHSNVEFINHLDNKIEFHRKLIQTYSINLVCLCVKYSKLVTREQEKVVQETGYKFEIDGINLYITISNVKHTFGLEKFLSESFQFLRFQIPQEETFSIQSCTLNSMRNTLKVGFLSEHQKFTENENYTFIVKPLQLIEENIRLRALKLNKSISKNINIVGQPEKKLTFNWNCQPERHTESPSLMDLKPKRDARKTSVCNLLNRYEIKGVEYKKSVEKMERDHSKSFTKSEKNIGIKKAVPANILERKNKAIASNNCKKMTSSGLGESNNKTLTVKKTNGENQLSNQSFYTAKKGEDFPEQLLNKKLGQNKIKTKQNNIESNSSFIGKTNSKLGCITEARNYKESQMSLKSSLYTDGRMMNKNISQAKIAQVSRTLLGSKNFK